MRICKSSFKYSAVVTNTAVMYSQVVEDGKVEGAAAGL